jgi:predicted nucleic acid-binding protein
MSLTFDTSILIAIERGDINIKNKLEDIYRINPGPPQLLFIPYFEFLLGIKLRKPKRSKEILNFLDKFNLLTITKNTAGILADLKIKYDDEGKSLPLADLLIASQAIENHLTLITLDKDFEKIEELQKIVL